MFDAIVMSFNDTAHWSKLSSLSLGSWSDVLSTDRAFAGIGLELDELTEEDITDS